MEGWKVGPVRQAGVGWIKEGLEGQGPGGHERVLGRAVVGSATGFRKS